MAFYATDAMGKVDNINNIVAAISSLKAQVLLAASPDHWKQQKVNNV